MLALTAVVNCKEAPKEMKSAEMSKTDAVQGEKDSPEKAYPEALTRVFDAHGGLENWRNKRTLTFTIPKPDGAETHTIDLYGRRDKIEMPTASMGYTGAKVWVLDEKNSYKGNPAMYHNLMFYFYTMPWVLADDGINYGETEPLQFEGKSYPGIQVSYNAGVGVSPKDEYYLYYDPETHQMAWLGYTVTFRSNEKSEDVSYIRYADWMQVDDVMLPKTLTWYNSDGSTIKEAKNTVTFENVSLSETAQSDGFYEMPENAEAVK